MPTDTAAGSEESASGCGSAHSPAGGGMALCCLPPCWREKMLRPTDSQGVPDVRVPVFFLMVRNAPAHGCFESESPPFN